MEETRQLNANQFGLVQVLIAAILCYPELAKGGFPPTVESITSFLNCVVTNLGSGNQQDISTLKLEKT